MKTATYGRTVTQSEVNKFAEISGDDNPIHVDREAAKDSMFGRRVVHGALTTSYVSAALADVGDSIVLLSLDMSYESPVYPGDRVEVTVTPTIHLSDNRCEVDVEVRVPGRDERSVASSGTAIIMDMGGDK